MPSPWWKSQRHTDRRPLLMARNAIKAELRAWFASNGFVEVEPGCLQFSPGNEPHLHAFKTEVLQTDGSVATRYLHTSPEFAMKKLLAAGERRIFSFMPVFRNRERGALHAPEFTMLEWYRVREPYEKLFVDCEAIVRIAARATGRKRWSWRNNDCNAIESFERLPVCDSFKQYAGFAIDDILIADLHGRNEFAQRSTRAGVTIADDDSWSDIFSKVLTALVEPKLGMGRPTVLFEYPIQEAALARPVSQNAGLAERFELFIAGVELANGFGELTDATEQRARFQSWQAVKHRVYGDEVPIDEDFLTALAELPDASGCALGFDRLVMLATGASRVDQVIWTPFGDE